MWGPFCRFFAQFFEQFGTHRGNGGVLDRDFGEITPFVGIVDLRVAGRAQFGDLAGRVEGDRIVGFAAFVGDFIAPVGLLGDESLQLRVEALFARFGGERHWALHDAARAHHRRFGRRRSFGFAQFELRRLGEGPALPPFAAGRFWQLGVVEALDFQVDGRAFDLDVALVIDEVAVGDVDREFWPCGFFFFAIAVGQREALHHVLVLHAGGGEVFEEDFAFAFEADLVSRDDEKFVLARGDPRQLQLEVFLHFAAARRAFG